MHDSWIKRLREEVLNFQLWGQLFLKGLLEDSWACIASGHVPRARLSTTGAVQILEDSWRMDPSRALHTFLCMLSSLNDTSVIQQPNTLIFMVSVLKCRKHYTKMLQAVCTQPGELSHLVQWPKGQGNIMSSLKEQPCKTCIQSCYPHRCILLWHENVVHCAQRTNKYLNENIWKL